MLPKLSADLSTQSSYHYVNFLDGSGEFRGLESTRHERFQQFVIIDTLVEIVALNDISQATEVFALAVDVCCLQSLVDSGCHP